MCSHLQEVSPRGLRAIFERFRGILHEGVIDKRVQYTIENLFAVSQSSGTHKRKHTHARARTSNHTRARARTHTHTHTHTHI